MSDTFEVEVGDKGRVVIPAAIRGQLRLKTGSRLIAMVDQGSVVLAPRSVIKKRLRGLFAGLDRSLASELIAERRAEAARD